MFFFFFKCHIEKECQWKKYRNTNSALIPCAWYYFRGKLIVIHWVIPKLVSTSRLNMLKMLETLRYRIKESFYLCLHRRKTISFSCQQEIIVSSIVNNFQDSLKINLNKVIIRPLSNQISYSSWSQMIQVIIKSQ